MIVPSKGIRERFTEKIVRAESEGKSRVHIHGQQIQKNPSTHFFHSICIYEAPAESGHPGAGDTVMNKTVLVRANSPGRHST